MSLARKCDMCGKFYDIESGNEPTSIKIYQGYSLYRELDLCEDCFESFKRWRLGVMKNANMASTEN